MNTKKVADPPLPDNPAPSGPHRPREAVVSFTPADIARVGVGFARVRMWLAGQLPEGEKIDEQDVIALESAAEIVRDIHEQVSSSEVDVYALINEGSADATYQRLAELMRVPYEPGATGSIYKLARRCVAKLELDELRKG